MKNINWKVRVLKKSFWLAIVPALALLVQLVLGWFGIDFAADLVGEQATLLINGVFTVLAILGIVVDPTTKGLKDSEKAQEYTKPN